MDNNQNQEKQLNQENQLNQPQNWADIILTPDTPISLFIGFLNDFNQRLVAIENLIVIGTDKDGNQITLTDRYKEQFKQMIEVLSNNHNNQPNSINETKNN